MDKGVAGALVTPESIASPDAPKKMVGSAFICEAEHIDQCVSDFLFQFPPSVVIVLQTLIVDFQSLGDVEERHLLYVGCGAFISFVPFLHYS